MGGNPLRLLRLAPGGVRLLGALAGGAAVPAGAGAQRLVRRLLDGGLVHPRPGRGRLSPADVSVVVPVRDDAGPLARLLTDGAALDRVARVVVVDDGSIDPDEVRRVCAAATGVPAAGVELVWCPRPGGPGSARTVGLDRCDTALVAFVDADCVPGPGWLEPLLPHFEDPAVAAVAPRVRPAAPPSETAHQPAPSLVLLAYEEHCSPLDLGAAEDRVRPGGRVPYVPTAALVARRHALHAVGGFDRTMSVGEDVDLVWRLGGAGWTIRYEPAALVHHDARPDLTEFVFQRCRYGTSAAPLARRHAGSLAPLRVSGWSAAAWGLAALGRPAAGAAVATTTTALLARRLGALAQPHREALRIAGRGHLMAGRSIAEALRRVWWPVLVPLALVSRRARRLALAAALVPALAEWVERRPRLDPLRWCALRLLDDLAYGAGVWAGCWRERTVAPLVPDLSNWPGRRSAVEDTPAGRRDSQQPHRQPTETPG